MTMTLHEKSSTLFGRTEPRLFTPSLRELTPETSYGFAVIRFADKVLGQPLDPWQQWIVIHAGELLPDGRPRFRRVLLLVARQNGKTHLLKVLVLFWMFAEKWPNILATSSSLAMAKELWDAVDGAVQDTAAMKRLLKSVRRANGDNAITTIEGSRFLFKAANRKGGRGLSLDRICGDELREHRNWEAYHAAYPAMSARPFGQAWFTSNAGDDESVVLNQLRDDAESGVDQRLGMFEYSAPPGCKVTDEVAWTYANPNLGYRLEPDDLRGPALLAELNGGEDEAGFRTESLCQRVKKMNAAIDPQAWESTKIPGDMSAARSSIALCLDVSPDGLHATLCAAARVDEQNIRVEIVQAWHGLNCMMDLRRDLPGWIATVKPRALGWFPIGPGAALAADMIVSPKDGQWPRWLPRNVALEDVKDSYVVCMGFAEQVRSGLILHAEDKLLDDHVLGAEKLETNGRFVFSRKGSGHCDAAYAVAGAVHIARTLPIALSTRVPMSSAVRAEVERMRAERTRTQ